MVILNIISIYIIKVLSVHSSKSPQILDVPVSSKRKPPQQYSYLSVHFLTVLTNFAHNWHRNGTARYFYEISHLDQMFFNLKY